MHVLHVLSNHKWSERAEPAVDLALAQQTRGVDVTFVCGSSGLAEEDSVAYHALQRGLELLVLRMRKHLEPFSVLQDRLALRCFLKRHPADIVHTHMPNAHLIAALATRGLASRPLMIRSCYEIDGPEHQWRARLLLARATDGLIVISPQAKQATCARFDFDPTLISVIEPGIALGRFAEHAGENPRAQFGLRQDEFVLGIVSRVREDRRLDVVLEAMRRLKDRLPALRLLLVGRGLIEELIERPAVRMGIGDRIMLAGYCRDDRLVAAYHAMDALAYPMPGTDQSCRTVREAMAAGVPVIASHVGFLPELVQDGVTGKLARLSAEAFAAAIAELATDREKLDRLASASRATARLRFAPELQADRTLAFYRLLLGTHESTTGEESRTEYTVPG